MATTSEAVEQFLASLRARHAPANTIKAYSHDLRHFLAAVPTLLVEVTAPLIQAFLLVSQSPPCASRWDIAICKVPCAMLRWIRPLSSRTSWNISGARGSEAEWMAKTYSWSTDAEEMRRLFILTYHDLQFLEPSRADAQRLYRALVLVWARVERVLVSDRSRRTECNLMVISAKGG